MFAIEIDPAPGEPRLESATIRERRTIDFGLWTHWTQRLAGEPTGGITSRDVLSASSCWQYGQVGLDKITEPPRHIADDIRRLIDAYGCLVCVGNAGPELLMHHAVSTDAERNISALLGFADWAFSIAGARLALSPMFFPIVFDLKTGGRLLRWAASHNVPLIWYWGWRLLYPPDEQGEILAANGSAGDKHQQIEYDWQPYKHPYDEISGGIRETGVEVWTGAGFSMGLERGSLIRAQAFGYKGVMTYAGMWREAERNIREKTLAANKEGENKTFWRTRHDGNT